jgi:hypothetical protein
MKKLQESFAVDISPESSVTICVENIISTLAPAEAENVRDRLKHLITLGMCKRPLCDDNQRCFHSLYPKP